jgi:hypothetical protein
MQDMLQFFEYERFPERLQSIIKPFHTLAHEMMQTLPQNRFSDVAMWKLLEAKDCVVKAVLYKDE